MQKELLYLIGEVLFLEMEGVNDINYSKDEEISKDCLILRMDDGLRYEVLVRSVKDLKVC